MNKYKLLIISLFIFSIYSLHIVKAKEEEAKLTLLGKIIYIDPGHGGIDPGAISKTITEKELNLIFATKLQTSLLKKGAIAYLTRNEDKDLANPKATLRKRSDLSKRAKLINDSKADLYVSIHLNASNDSSWRGFQVFYDDINKDNKKFSEIITKQVSTKIKNVKLPKEKNDYYMYSRIKVPGALIELGYITNPNDNYLLRKEYYQNTLINEITKGIEIYLQEEK